MALPSRNKPQKKTSGSFVAALVILVLVVGIVAGYVLFSPSEKITSAPRKSNPSTVKPSVPTTSAPQATVPSPPAVVPLPMYKKQNQQPDTLPEAEKDVSGSGTSGMLAIIIDDMGGSISEARSLAAIKVPLTFAIIPGLRDDKDVAAYAALHKIEIIIHIPMQSKGWPERRLESNGLLVSMDANELQERASGFVQQVPGAVGANNHMGSEFTEHADKMADVLQVLKKNNLFFIDSVTSSESAGVRVAQRLGINSARRSVFLDNEQERGYILGQLNQAVRLARKNGSAIAICHPHPVTIATLATALPELAGRGVRLVQASHLVK